MKQNFFEAGRLDACIVDLDGTMVDTLGDFEVALNAMLTDLSLPAVDRITIARMVGKGSEHLIRSVLDHVLALCGPAAGTAPVRCAAQFPQSRKVTLTHQHVLVFCKGDPRRAANWVNGV